MSQPLKFAPFSSTVEASFWMKLSELKLHEIRLSESGVNIYGRYGRPRLSSSLSSSGEQQLVPLRLRLDQDSFSSSDYPLRNEEVECMGSIRVYNTVESFKRCDKNETLKSYCSDILKLCENGDDMNVLNKFLCLCYLDLKKHSVVYWFAFPALVWNVGTKVEYEMRSLMESEGVCMKGFYDEWREFRRSKMKNGLQGYFMAINLDKGEGVKVLELNKRSYESLSSDERISCTFGFVDPSSSDHPGWPLRNLVAFLVIGLKLGDVRVNILSFRPGIIRRMSCESTSSSGLEVPIDDASNLLSIRLPMYDSYNDCKCVGWESNSRGKMGPRYVTLQSQLDPSHLAKQATNLNISLMKWRMIPDLKMTLVQQTKCLLIGAGTLGCNVARTLLGWGVNHITFVDNSKVSYSNPVRQSLFELKDCDVEYKAIAAANAIKRIAPVHSEGFVMSIPMPGHAMDKDGSDNNSSNDLSRLESLIRDHDVIFLLTDTRESRWLPTLIGKHFQKVVINAALGLDTYLVMRHGNNSQTNDLGCYFCNDVVAPENSTNNRTLDQQCTVTRPGLAPIAGSMAVELMVSLLHHHPHDTNNAKHSTNTHSSPLGLVPHQIRGSVATYDIITPKTPPFQHCTACSKVVLDHFDKQGHDFVMKVCIPGQQGIDYLEQVSGLKHYRNKVEMLDVDLDWDADDDDDTSASSKDDF